MDAKGALAAALRRRPLEFEPRRGRADLFGDGDEHRGLAARVPAAVRRVPLVGRIGPLARTFDFVADAAPGVKEILGVGKLAYEVRERHYDLVVVDAEASGHIVAQVGAPRVIGELVQVGMVRDQTRWMLDILEDPARTGVVVVTTPEEMPVTETIELLDRFAAETEVDAAAIVANRVLPALFDREESAVVDQPRRGRAGCSSTPPDPASATSSLAAQLTEARRVVGSRAPRAPARLAMPPDLPILYVPELFTRATGRRVVALVADGARRGTGRGVMATGPRPRRGCDAAGRPRRAAGEQGDGPRLRVRRRRQDDDRRRARRWPRPSSRAARCSC